KRFGSPVRNSTWHLQQTCIILAQACAEKRPFRSCSRAIGILWRWAVLQKIMAIRGRHGHQFPYRRKPVGNIRKAEAQANEAMARMIRCRDAWLNLFSSGYFKAIRQ